MKKIIMLGVICLFGSTVLQAKKKLDDQTFKKLMISCLVKEDRDAQKKLIAHKRATPNKVASFKIKYNGKTVSFRHFVRVLSPNLFSRRNLCLTYVRENKENICAHDQESDEKQIASLIDLTTKNSIFQPLVEEACKNYKEIYKKDPEFQNVDDVKVYCETYPNSLVKLPAGSAKDPAIQQEPKKSPPKKSSIDQKKKVAAMTAPSKQRTRSLWKGLVVLGVLGVGIYACIRYSNRAHGKVNTKAA